MAYARYAIALIGVVLHCYVVHCQDCSSNLRSLQKYVTVKETDLNGTLVVQLEHSNTRVDWSASISGGHQEFISDYFTEERNSTHFWLVLAKRIDLEFISTDLNMEIGDQGILIIVTIQCLESSTEPSQASLTLSVQPVNEFFPDFIRAPYEITVRENTPIGTEVFSFKDRVVDMDVGTHLFSYKITPYMITEFDGRRLFEINTEIGSVTVAAELDYEQLPRSGRNYYFLNVTVKDSGGFGQSTSVKVTIEDVNDLSIEFIYPGCFQSCDGVNVSYYVETNESYTGILDVLPVPLKARDLDAIETPIEYLLLSEKKADFFNVDGHTGDIYKTAPLINDSLGYEIELEVLIREIVDETHNLTANITVFIMERLPTTDSVERDAQPVQIIC